MEADGRLPQPAQTLQVPRRLNTARDPDYDHWKWVPDGLFQHTMFRVRPTPPVGPEPVMVTTTTRDDLDPELLAIATAWEVRVDPSGARLVPADVGASR